MAKEKNIYEKLLVIQKHVKGLSKDKKSHNFDYVTGNKLLGFIRPKMDELGLLLKQEVLTITNERIDYATKYAEKSEILSSVMMKFTWKDAATGEEDVNMFGANGMNGWDKGVGSAITYAERYFIMKYFHIPTDEDDIDNPEVAPTESPSPKVTPKPAPVSNTVATAADKAKEKGFVDDKQDYDNAKMAYKKLYGKYPSSKMTAESIWTKVAEKSGEAANAGAETVAIDPTLENVLEVVSQFDSKETFKEDGKILLEKVNAAGFPANEVDEIKKALNAKFKTL